MNPLFVAAVMAAVAAAIVTVAIILYVERER